MSDDLSKKRPQDAEKVNVHESWELNYWSKHFNITPEKLKEVVRKVGDKVSDVKRYLGK